MSSGRLLWPVLRAAVLPLLILALFFLARRLGLGGDLTAWRSWIESLGPWGYLVYVLAYILSTVAALPGLPMTLAAGALFGSIKGVILVSIGSALGAGAAFLLARTLAREAVSRWLSGRAAFQRLETWTRDQGAVVVALSRIFPIVPYSMINFAFGLTALGFWTFLFWTWLCMLPGTALYVLGMDAFLQGVSEGRVPWPLVITMAGCLALILALVPWARGRLRRWRT